MGGFHHSDGSRGRCSWLHLIHVLGLCWTIRGYSCLCFRSFQWPRPRAYALGVPGEKRLGVNFRLYRAHLDRSSFRVSSLCLRCFYLNIISVKDNRLHGKTALTPLRSRCLALEDEPEGPLVPGTTICASLASQVISELPRLFSVS